VNCFTASACLRAWNDARPAATASLAGVLATAEASELPSAAAARTRPRAAGRVAEALQHRRRRAGSAGVAARAGAATKGRQTARQEAGAAAASGAALLAHAGAAPRAQQPCVACGRIVAGKTARRGADGTCAGGTCPDVPLVEVPFAVSLLQKRWPRPRAHLPAAAACSSSRGRSRVCDVRARQP
jgi:hypothetical protein